MRERIAFLGSFGMADHVEGGAERPIGVTPSPPPVAAIVLERIDTGRRDIEIAAQIPLRVEQPGAAYRPHIANDPAIAGR
jgi:hypothetical protein